MSSESEAGLAKGRREARGAKGEAGRGAGAASAQALQRAMALHKAGDLAAAQTIYEDLVEQEPRHAEALNLLGVLASQGVMLRSDLSGPIEVELRPIEGDAWLRVSVESTAPRAALDPAPRRILP